MGTHFLKKRKLQECIGQIASQQVLLPFNSEQQTQFDQLLNLAHYPKDIMAEKIILTMKKNINTCIAKNKLPFLRNLLHLFIYEKTRASTLGAITQILTVLTSNEKEQVDFIAKLQNIIQIRSYKALCHVLMALLGKIIEGTKDIIRQQRIYDILDSYPNLLEYLKQINTFTTTQNILENKLLAPTKQLEKCAIHFGKHVSIKESIVVSHFLKAMGASFSRVYFDSRGLLPNNPNNKVQTNENNKTENSKSSLNNSPNFFRPTPHLLEDDELIEKSPNP